MGMPLLGEVPLLAASGAPCAGAAFELQRAGRPATVVINGWQIQVTPSGRMVIARGGNERSYDDALDAAHDQAQRGLDLLSIRGDYSRVITKAEDEHVVWWPEADGLVIRITNFAGMGFAASGAMTVIDAHGNIVPPPPARPEVWHESFRYFRLSQTTEDLFDGYRNAYLALESILSSIRPQRGEPEEVWFTDAVTEAGKLISLTDFVPAGTPDPARYLVGDLYYKRTAMSHAKLSHAMGRSGNLVPQTRSERQKVAASLQRLTHLYLKLVEAHLGVRRGGGGITVAGFQEMLPEVLNGMTLNVSDDESPWDKREEVPNPAGGAMRELISAAPARPRAPFVASRLWSATGPELADLPFIRRVVGINDKRRGAAWGVVLPERLVLGSARRLEVLLGARGSNIRQPRAHYAF